MSVCIFASLHSYQMNGSYNNDFSSFFDKINKINFILNSYFQITYFNKKVY